MFRIREFSRFSRVSVKMLRHYDRLGLLRPSFVDPDSRYRFYSASQLPRLHRLVALKDLGFSLEHIATLLDRQLSPGELAGMLRLRRLELERQIERDHARLEQIDARLGEIEAGEPAGLDVVVRDVEAVPVASIRARVDDLDRAVAGLFDELETEVARSRARAFGSPMLVYHDAEYREREAEVEVAVPVTEAFEANGRAARGEMPRLEGAACAVYTGPYEQLAAVLAAMLAWIEAQRLAIAGPMREVYHQFNATDARALRLPPEFLVERDADFVTEIQVPVRKRETSGEPGAVRL